MRKLPLILSVVIAVFLLTVTLQRGLTQDGPNSCPTLVKQALQAVGNNCGGLTRNSACYGFNRVNATFSQTVDEGAFSKPSDQTGLKTLQSIDTAPLSDALKEWGVAVMSVLPGINGVCGTCVIRQPLCLGPVGEYLAQGSGTASMPGDQTVGVLIFEAGQYRCTRSSSPEWRCRLRRPCASSLGVH